MSKTLKDALKKHDPSLVIEDLRKELEAAKANSLTAKTITDVLGTTVLDLNKYQAPVWTYEPKQAKALGVPHLTLSDLHWGERVFKDQLGGVNEFNLTIARRRLKTVIHGTIALAQRLDPEMRYPGMTVALGGDMAGGDIHEELKSTNELPTIPIVLDLFDELVPGLTLLADSFGKLLIPCVTGNHDRNGKKIQAKDRHFTSYAWLLYQFLARHFREDERFTFYIPDSSDALYQNYGVRYNLTHGDQFRGGDGIIGPLGPITRGDQKKLVARQAVNQDYDVLVYGHFHQRIITPRQRGNGTLKGYDEFAYTNNFRFEPPTQNFWVTHPDHGIIWDTPVFCEPNSLRRKTAWASIPKKVA